MDNRNFDDMTHGDAPILADHEAHYRISDEVMWSIRKRAAFIVAASIVFWIAIACAIRFFL